MNKEYIKIINQLSSLKKNIKDPYIYCNNYLNINEEHSHEYENINKFPISKTIATIFFLKTFFLSVTKYILIILINFKLKNVFFHKKNKILIISHNINNKLKYDFYFHNLVKFLDKKKIGYNVYKINHTKNKNTTSSYLDTFTELKIFCKLVYSFFKLINLFLKSKLLIPKNVYLNVLSNHISNTTARNIRISYNIRNILKTNPNSLVFFTFEGYAWERAVIALNKLNNQSNIFIGVQHAYINNSNLNIFDFKNYKFNPDIILASGNTTHKKFLQYKNIKTYNFGSLKSNHHFINFNNKNLKNNTFLILPNANRKEVDDLLIILNLLATKYNNYKFIWRSHPSFPATNFSNHEIFKKKYVTYSYNSFEHDLTRSNHAIYKTSSAVITSTKYGLRPIHISFDMSEDPLTKINNSWKFNLSNIGDIDKLDYYLNKKVSLNEKKYVINYCSSYFDNFNENKFKIFLDEYIY